MASKILLSFKLHSEKEVKQDRKRKMAEDPTGREGESGKKVRKVEEEEETSDPLWPKFPGGKGRARVCEWKGNQVPFHDGGCLQSPGRWDLGSRIYPEQEGWAAVRKDLVALITERAGGEAKLERECFSMSRGGEGVKLAKDEGLLEVIRKKLWSFCGSPEGGLERAEGQPFWLSLVKDVLEKAGDSDFEFLKEAETGLPLGIKHPLPRTPQSFERQTEWALQDDPTMEYAMARPNYPSAAEHEQHLRDHLEAEVKEGLMEKMTTSEFERKFGQDRAIASLAVLVEDEISGKKRVIHDGTHGIRVNHRIKSLDKLRMPGGREKKYLLRGFRMSRDIAFSLFGDFGKAHRRFKYREDERGYLGCKVKQEEEIVYVNKVGTFGVNSTPYWWGRISGALIRLCHAILGPDFPVEMLLYADDLEVMGIGSRGRKGAVITFVILAAVGAPFKWAKQRGGVETEWIGLMTNYGSYSFGLSERRAAWLSNWIEVLTQEKMVWPREFAAGLGRMGFAATALPWERPFLGPLYSWSSAVISQRGKVVLPWSVLMIMDWISRRLKDGGRMQEVKVEKKVEGEKAVIYTDARASEEDACLGGYLAISEDLKECPWFSVPVDVKLAPWLYSKGGVPKRVIASLELLATILAVKVWGSEGGAGLVAKMKAFTDNRGNAFALKRGMSTKFPLALLLMELAEELRSKDLSLDLEWVKRDMNVEADALSNGDWSKFSESKRIQFDMDNMGWKILPEIMARGEELYREVSKLKEEKKEEKKSKSARRAAGGRKVLPKW